MLPYLSQMKLYFKFSPNSFHLYFHFINSRMILQQCIFLSICKIGRGVSFAFGALLQCLNEKVTQWFTLLALNLFPHQAGWAVPHLSGGQILPVVLNWHQGRCVVEAGRRQPSCNHILQGRGVQNTACGPFYLARGAPKNFRY